MSVPSTRTRYFETLAVASIDDIPSTKQKTKQDALSGHVLNLYLGTSNASFVDEPGNRSRKKRLLALVSCLRTVVVRGKIDTCSLPWRLMSLPPLLTFVFLCGTISH